MNVTGILDTIEYFRCIQADETVAAVGDIIKVDWTRDMDGTPAFNMTQNHTYCPFRTDNRDGKLMEKITEREAHEALYLKAGK